MYYIEVIPNRISRSEYVFEVNKIEKENESEVLRKFIDQTTNLLIARVHNKCFPIYLFFYFMFSILYKQVRSIRKCFIVRKQQERRNDSFNKREG